MHGLVVRFGRYLVSGFVALAVHLMVLTVLVETVALNASVATSIGFVSGLIVNYLIQHRWVFRATGAHSVLFARYAAVTLVTFALNILLFRIAFYGLGLWYLPAQILASGVIFVANFIINLQYTFRWGT